MNPLKIISRAIFALAYAVLCILRISGWVFYSAMDNLVSEIETEAELKRRRNILRKNRGITHEK